MPTSEAVIDQLLKLLQGEDFIGFEQEPEIQDFAPDYVLDPVARFEQPVETEQAFEPFTVQPRKDVRTIEEVPAQERAVLQHGAVARAKPKRWMRDYDNGYIPLDAMATIEGGVHYMRPDAAKAYKAMQRAAKKAGVNFAVTDSYRTYQQQVELKNRKGDLAATPGKSNHGWGIALDINVGAGTMDDPAYKWLAKNAERFGFDQPMSYEPWHWEYGGGFSAPRKRPRTKRIPQRAQPEPEFVDVVRPPSDPLVELPMPIISVMGEIKAGSRARGAREYERSQGLGFVPARFRKLFQVAARRYGLDARLLAFIAKHESGFDPKAVSSAGAQGLMQVMPLHGLENPFNPRANVMKGASIFASYLNKAEGNLRLALAYYNAGPNADPAVIQERMRLYSDPILAAFRGEAA